MTLTPPKVIVQLHYIFGIPIYHVKTNESSIYNATILIEYDILKLVLFIIIFNLLKELKYLNE